MLSAVLEMLRQRGVYLSVDGTDLIWEADREPSTAEARWITANKSALLRELNCLRVDFETISPLDLTQVGTAVYVAHRETRVLILAWCIGADPVQIWWPGEPIPPEIVAAIGAGAVLVSHGPFDRIVWNAKLVPWVGPPCRPSGGAIPRPGAAPTGCRQGWRRRRSGWSWATGRTPLASG